MLSRLESVSQDLRVAARSLRRFAVPNASLVLLLGLGIGATTAVLTLVERVLLAPLSAPEPEQLVLLRRVDASGDRADGFPIALVDVLRGASRSVSSLSAYDYTRMDVRARSSTEPATGRLVSGSGFALIGARPLLGRSLGIGDDLPSRANVAMLSFGYWQRRFGGDASVIGSVIDVDGAPVTIVGVLSPDFTGLSVGEAPEDLWLPMAMHPTLGLKDHQEVGLIGRIARNSAPSAAAAKLTSLYRSAQQTGVVRERQIAPGDNRSRIEVEPAAQGLADLPHRLQQPLRLLLAAALLLLIVTWTNAAGLLAARTRTRVRELAVRLAIGASRLRLAQQLLIENVLITGLGSIAGALAAWWFVPVLVRVLVQDGMPMIDPAPDLRVVGIVAGLAIALALLFALAQLAVATRSDLNATLRSGRSVSESRSLASAGRALVAAQLAISLVLILDGLCVADAVHRVAESNPGFDREHVLIFWLFPSARGYAGVREQTLYRAVTERLALLPGARGASLVRYRPGIAREATCRAPVTAESPADVFVNVVGPAYFTAMSIPVIAGRDLSWSDGAGAPAVAIISQTTARRLFPERSPIGARLQLPDGSRDGAEVVGVVGDVSTYPMTPGQGTASSCDVYVPIGQARAADLGQMNFVVRAAVSSPTALTPAVRAAVASIDPELSVLGPESEAEVLHGFYAREESLSWLILGISVIAVIVGVAGLYGTLTLGVAMRLRELGIRIALGATSGDVQRLVIRQAASIVVVGVVLGLLATGGSVAVLRHVVFGLDRIRGGPAVTAMGALTLAALLASFFPVRRAAAVDPALIVREE